MPNILSVTKTERRTIIEIQIPSDLAHFSGHFPGLPILPGIVQVDWAIRLMQNTFDIAGERFVGIKGLKFSAPLLPDDKATLTIDLEPDKGRMLFNIQSGKRACTSGQYLFSCDVQQ
jgi:3-hydroxymyristoyl/3-hydroxydecanoyl-(acyl carrier protein) dehydratase